MRQESLAQNGCWGFSHHQDWLVTPGFVTHLCLGHRRNKGRRKGRKGEIQKWKGWSGFTKWPLKWEHPLLTELNPFAGLQELSTVLSAGVCCAWLPTKQQQSSQLQREWMGPMSGELQRLILKSFVLITLPEGKQRVRAACPHRHRRPQWRGWTWMSPTCEFTLWINLIFLNF